MTEKAIQHEPGLLVVRDDVFVDSDADTSLVLASENWKPAGGELVAVISERKRTHDGDRANARRLAAAWNFCDGISTDDLEKLGGPAEYVASEAYLNGLKAARGELSFEAEGNAVRVLGDNLAGYFHGAGGVNYVEMGLTSKHTGPLVLTLQRREGKTPAQVAGEALEQVRKLQAELLEASEKLLALEARQ